MTQSLPHFSPSAPTDFPESASKQLVRHDVQKSGEFVFGEDRRVREVAGSGGGGGSDNEIRKRCFA